MKALAQDELFALHESLPGLERRVQVLLLPKDEDDERLGHPGSPRRHRRRRGGAVRRRPVPHVPALRRDPRLAGRGRLASPKATLGGYKEIVAEITGDGVFGRLKFESGVHRVQRVPETEAQGRIHTSAATVAVLPEPEEVEIEIDDKDLRIDTYRVRAPAASTSTRPTAPSASPTCRPASW